jgi:hypothetical protein
MAVVCVLLVSALAEGSILRAVGTSLDSPASATDRPAADGAVVWRAMGS